MHAQSREARGTLCPRCCDQGRPIPELILEGRIGVILVRRRVGVRGRQR